MIPGNKVRMPGKETEWWRGESDERSMVARGEEEEERAREERGKGRYIGGARDLRAPGLEEAL
jgi:hypothetical protein